MSDVVGAPGSRKDAARGGNRWLWFWIVVFGLGLMGLTWLDLQQPGTDFPAELSR